MNPYKTVFRVSYSDTDQMGYMHHSNYFKYYETARWELFRSIGIPYHEIEKVDIILPVINATSKFIKPAMYDQEIKILTRVKSFKGARILFEYQAVNELGEIINEAQVVVACVRRSTGKACFPPKSIINILKELSENS